MTGQEWMEVIVMLLCFVLAALASGTETALTSVGRLRVRYLAEQGSQAAAILQRLRADPNRFLSTVLFTNTLALIVASTASALLSDALFTRWGVASRRRFTSAATAMATITTTNFCRNTKIGSGICKRAAGVPPAGTAPGARTPSFFAGRTPAARRNGKCAA